ncbi:hypothetical protein LCAC16_PC10005 [Leuconostoc carnosum]|nr:hypothetical protein LCAC16_PC10005 [Leuconostoc carnosum]
MPKKPVHNLDISAFYILIYRRSR